MKLPFGVRFVLFMISHVIASNFEGVSCYFKAILNHSVSQIVVLSSPAKVHVREAIYFFEMLLQKTGDSTKDGIVWYSID